MARKPRIHVPGGVYHVILRGNVGQDIFFNDEDLYHFYLLLQEVELQFGHRIHGFCLMGNQVHLAVQIGEEPLSKIRHKIGSREQYSLILESIALCSGFSAAEMVD